MREIIREATKNCDSDRCSLSVVASVTTLIAYAPAYDKNGDRIGAADPNTMYETLRCATCGQEWDVKTKGALRSVTSRNPTP